MRLYQARRLAAGIFAGMIGLALLLVSPSIAPAQAASAVNKTAGTKPDPGFITDTAIITLDVPILLYHHIGHRFKLRYNLPVKDFTAQMAYLAKNGYTTVSIDQIAAALRGQADLPPCPIALTFDDGYVSAYQNAVPILQQYGLRATFYVPTSFISQTEEYMNWDQVRDLIAKGMWIGSHSVTHPFLGRLSQLSVQQQITESRAILEARLGIPITTFAYPFGSLSSSVESAVKEAGYKAALWTRFSWRHSTDRLFRLKRVGVYYPINLSAFIARLPKHGPWGNGACAPLLQTQK